MATHAFVAYKLTIAPTGRPKDLSVLDDINGTDLCNLVHGFLQDIEKLAYTDEASKQYLAVSGVSPIGRSIRFDGTFGAYGQAGNSIIDVETGKSIHELGDKDAYSTRLRNLLVIPSGSKIGLFLAERHSGRGLASIFLRELNKSLRQRFAGDKLTLRWEGLTNGEAWQKFLNDAQLTQIKVLKYAVSTDIADEMQSKDLYNLSFTAKPTRGRRFFASSIRDALINGNIKANTILGLSPDFEADETRLQMRGSTGQKEFALDQQSPVLIYPLAEDNEERPADDHVYESMEKVVMELCPTLHVDLDTNWQQGAWSADSLAVTLEAVRGS